LIFLSAFSRLLDGKKTLFFLGEKLIIDNLKILSYNLYLSYLAFSLVGLHFRFLLVEISGNEAYYFSFLRDY